MNIWSAFAADSSRHSPPQSIKFSSSLTNGKQRNLGCAGHQAHQHSQSFAVYEDDFAQVQHDVAAVAQQVNDMEMQDFGFAGGDAPATPDDGDLPDFACVQ